MALLSIHDKVAHCEDVIKYTFTNKAHLVRALNATGNRLHFEGEAVISNKTLATYGDLKMKSRIGDDWEEAGRDGETWDNVHKAILSNANLARIGFSMRLEPCITVYARTRVSDKMMETAIEAIAGAAWLDGHANGGVTAATAALDAVMEAMGLFKQTAELLAHLFPLPADLGSPFDCQHLVTSCRLRQSEQQCLK